jgi:hypothetical protein
MALWPTDRDRSGGETEVLEVLAMGLHTTERLKLRQIEEGLRADAPGLDGLPAGGLPCRRPLLRAWQLECWQAASCLREWTRHSRES